MAVQIKSSEQTMMADINVTPLVDVMLVLLIVFIVTAPLMMQAMPVKLPKTAAQGQVDPVKPVQLSIDSGGAVFIDTRPIERDALKARLQTARSADPEVNVQLSADERVPYGEVAKVMGIVQQAGIARLSFITVSE